MPQASRAQGQRAPPEIAFPSASSLPAPAFSNREHGHVLSSAHCHRAHPRDLTGQANTSPSLPREAPGQRPGCAGRSPAGPPRREQAASPDRWLLLCLPASAPTRHPVRCTASSVKPSRRSCLLRPAVSSQADIYSRVTLCVCPSNTQRLYRPPRAGTAPPGSQRTRKGMGSNTTRASLALSHFSLSLVYLLLPTPGKESTSNQEKGAASSAWFRLVPAPEEATVRGE